MARKLLNTGLATAPPTRKEQNMSYIVNETNIFTNIVIGTTEFSTLDDAIEYAQTMNELMEATPIRYKIQNW